MAHRYVVLRSTSSPVVADASSGQTKPPDHRRRYIPVAPDRMQMHECLALFAMPPRLTEQPVARNQFIVAQLRWAFAARIAQFDIAAGRIFTDCIPAQSGSSNDLSYGNPFAQKSSHDYA